MDCVHVRLLAFLQSQTEISPAFQVVTHYLTMHYSKCAHPILCLEE